MILYINKLLNNSEKNILKLNYNNTWMFNYQVNKLISPYLKKNRMTEYFWTFLIYSLGWILLCMNW